MKFIGTSLLLAGFLAGFTTFQATAADIPKVGDKAPDFTLKTLDDQAVKLSDLTAKGSVVLVVLRGWPGYQCPACDLQVQDFIKSAAAFSEAGARLLFVYPGPATDLKAHAKEFAGMKGRQWPKEFLYALDPDYSMVNAYGLRWDAPKETAYPSTFVIDSKGTIRSATVSKSHGDGRRLQMSSLRSKRRNNCRPAYRRASVNSTPSSEAARSSGLRSDSRFTAPGSESLQRA